MLEFQVVLYFSTRCAIYDRLWRTVPNGEIFSFALCGIRFFHISISSSIAFFLVLLCAFFCIKFIGGADSKFLLLFCLLAPNISSFLLACFLSVCLALAEICAIAIFKNILVRRIAFIPWISTGGLLSFALWARPI